MAGYRAVTPNITINTESGQLRTELLNTFNRLDGQLSSAPYRLNTTVGPVGTDAGGVDTTLAQHTVDYTTLSKSGSSIMIYISGVTAANANNKKVRLLLGTAELLDTTSLALNDVDWSIVAQIIRVGSTSQITTAVWTGSSTLTSKINNSFASVDLSQTTYIKLIGTGTAASDVQLYHMQTVLIA
jgi:hypothetical protein